MPLKLGSLFDGIGVFPLAAVNCGITPAWASEIEKAPVSITRRHFPEMEHLGDIMKLNGAELESVDILTFGSPCQNLSTAGDREGLAGKIMRCDSDSGKKLIKSMVLRTADRQGMC